MQCELHGNDIETCPQCEFLEFFELLQRDKWTVEMEYCPTRNAIQISITDITGRCFTEYIDPHASTAVMPYVVIKRLLRKYSTKDTVKEEGDS